MEECAMRKSDVLDLLRDQPEELDIDRFLYTLHMRRQIELGLAAADAVEEYSPEKFEKLSVEWTVAGYPPRIMERNHEEE
jgi:hypothetical protein